MNSAQFFRQAIAKQLARKGTCTESRALQLLGTPKVARHEQFTIPVPKLVTSQQDDTAHICKDIANKFEPDDWITNANAQGPFLNFDVSLTHYIRHTLNDVLQQKDKYGTRPPQPGTVLIDYSSPNIAKPFHAGHLRSTILGNFIKRSHEAMGYRTIGINYLGDWGKQYGLLAVGYEKYGDEDALMKDPVYHLYNTYVAINKDAATNKDIDQAANQYFKRMEQGDVHTLSLWRRFRTLSIDFYRQIYQRLGITFDHYSGESQTEQYISKVYAQLEARGLLTESEGGECVVDLEHYGLGKPVLKRTDGTTLYLTRDLAALLLRKESYDFDKAIYVVGTEQSLYMQQLFKVWQLLTGEQELHHANFGRIQGMSTRKGTVVFLQDILDTAKDRMMENMQQSTSKYEELTTLGITSQSDGTLIKGQAAADHVADQLGISAVMIQDMVAKRIKNYTFSWDRMTMARGYTGVYLQFTYARLCGIERKAQVEVTPLADTTLLLDSDAAVDLVLTISQYPDIVHQSWAAMEPSTLVQYLFRLAHSISQATTLLRVKDVDPGLAQARMMLFWSAKTTLGNGLKLLGMTPLERI
ncbi:arginyl-tRNA synthetase [Chlamydoabsidia padenii]|nr:arginyl-tRNA synthetase [Chlamydoabsidia padenii]